MLTVGFLVPLGRSVRSQARLRALAGAQSDARGVATALAAVAGVRVALSPYLPFSTVALDDELGPVDAWQRREPVPGSPIGKPVPLFAKVDVVELLAGDDG